MTARELRLLLRLARIVQAMAAETPLHDQAFDLVADIESLAADREMLESPGLIKRADTSRGARKI